MGSMQLSRSQIYEMIWSKPIQQVAPTLGLSDVGLAKLCKRYDIPRPPRGYWAKLQHGQAPPKSPLPDPGRDPRVRFEDAGQNASDRSTPEFNRIRVTYPIPEGASHPLVAKARSHFERLEPNKTGLLVPRKHCPLNVRVSPAQLDRALAVVDALLCAFESRGERVEAGPSVVVGGYRFGFEVREELEEAEEPLEPDLSGEYEFHHRRKKIVERLSGVLCLQITGGGSAAKGMQRNYRDSQRTPLEGRLESIANSIPRAIARDRNRQIREAAEQREIAAKAEQRRQERERIRAHVQKQDDEQALLDELLANAESWHRARLLREYIAEIQGRLDWVEDPKELENIKNYIRGALMHADRIDPLTKSPASILDEDLTEARRMLQQGWWR